jgi:hypothetical protein
MTLVLDRPRDRMAQVGRAVPILRAGVLARYLCRRGASAEVAAVFERSFYLRAGGAFVCIGEPSIGNGPLTLIVDAPVSGLGLRQGQAAAIDERCIAIDGLPFTLDRCKTWHPPRWPGVASPARLQEAAAALARRAAASPPDGLAYAISGAADTPLARIARPRIADFESWLSAISASHRITHDSSCPAKAGHPVDTPVAILACASRLLDRPLSRTTTARLSTNAVAGLIGLGPGLTPSGDDFLIGALALLDALGEQTTHAALAHAVAPAAPSLTSPLSARFLMAAANGYVGEHLHRAVTSIVAGDVDAAVAAARRIGHTSGWDMLAGVATTLRIVAATR